MKAHSEELRNVDQLELVQDSVLEDTGIDLIQMAKKKIYRLQHMDTYKWQNQIQSDIAVLDLLLERIKPINQA